MQSETPLLIWQVCDDNMTPEPSQRSQSHPSGGSEAPEATSHMYWSAN
jgi:hypothetical protein